jgi:hypothetical protein
MRYEIKDPNKGHQVQVMSRNIGVEKRLNFSYQENFFVLCFTIEQVGFKRKENE